MMHRVPALLLWLAGALAAAEITTVAGPIRLRLTDDLAFVQALAARAAAAGIFAANETPGELVTNDPLLGPHLDIGEVLITPDAVLRPEVIADHDDQSVLHALAAAVQTARDEIASEPVGGPGHLRRQALLEALDHLGPLANGVWHDRPISSRDPPEHIACLIADGWLDAQAPTVSGEVTAAVRGALTFERRACWSDDTRERCTWRDAVGRSVETYRSPERSAYAMPAPVMQYLAGCGIQPTLIVELPAGSDPLAPDEAALDGATATLSLRGKNLARCAPDGEFTCDRAAWRQRYPNDERLVPEARPPHVAICDPSGALRRLATSEGILKPPSAAETDAERFADEAARILVSPGALDLLGEYCFTYFYDSPDPASPRCFGSSTLHGDLHQTWRQSLATASSGRMRGDCDDLAEVYHEILRRQEHLPIVLSFPGHLAAGWAIKQGDDGWRLNVLQTGPPLSWSADDLQDALRACFAGFAPGQPFNPESVPLALRFAGENTRTTWRLGWRIFSEPAYAAAMIDVQRAWYFRTYGDAVHTMEAMIAAGDHDSANYGEIAGLYRRTGQWSQAILWKERTIERIDDPADRLNDELELLGLLVADHRDSAADDLASDLAGRIASAELDTQGQRFSRLSGLLGQINRPAHRELIDHILTEQVLPMLEAEALELADLFPRATKTDWRQDARLIGFRRLLAVAISIAEARLRRDGLSNLTSDPLGRRLLAMHRLWLDFVCGAGLERSDLLHGVAMAGWGYELLIGHNRMDEVLRHAGAPPEIAGTARCGGVAQLLIDAPYLAISPPYWRSRFTAAIWGWDGETPPGDLPSAKIWAVHVADAATQARDRDLLSAASERICDEVALEAAILAEDHSTVRAVLIRIGTVRDRSAIESSASILGRCARFCSEASFARYLADWHELVHEKAFALEIAWAAAGIGAPERALQAALVAVHEYPDDPAFASEHEYLRGVAPTLHPFPATTP